MLLFTHLLVFSQARNSSGQFRPDDEYDLQRETYLSRVLHVGEYEPCRCLCVVILGIMISSCWSLHGLLHCTLSFWARVFAYD